MTKQLKFNVRGQMISRADRFLVVEKSQYYLYADFDFLTEEWRDLVKIAVFTKDGVPYKIILDENGSCRVPWETLRSTGMVEVSVYGVGQDEGIIIATANKSGIIVASSGYVDIAENEGDPTPTVVEQIFALISKLGTDVDGGTFEDWKGDDE